ncbi:unnamed protein product [Phytophthora fragariaefolia]|uniref:Unnamed protein product n=1 Tax=Phytophthora fragariaefolia TaxID=1490495 RepID=A0A9W6TMP8_9STRA|nr:unnamed protein product [Phytophthora fragariaefolia]
MMQNAHRMRAIDGPSGGAGGAAGAGLNSGGSEKDKEVREPTPTGSTGASLSTLVDQFVTSLTSRKRPLDERQVKLAHRLQTNVSGFSPEKIRRLQRRKPLAHDQGLEATGGEQSYQSPRGDASFQLLREAIDEGTSRMRATRNGVSFLQMLPPSDLHGLRELQEKYLRARTKTPQPTGGGNGTRSGARSCPRRLLGSKTHDEERHRTKLNRDEDTPHNETESEDDKTTWYLPYTTRQLQRSPHRRLPSLEEFRVQVRDEKQPSRPFRASSNIKPNPLPNRLQVTPVRSIPTSLIPRRGSVGPPGGTLITAGENTNDYTKEFNVSLIAGHKGASSPFSIVTAAPISPPSAPLHSIEKLQAAVDALEATKYQQSARLVTALEVLEQDRHDCLSGKFRSLRVRCDATEDLRRMRERSERCRGQRVHVVLSKTANWYPELLRRLLAREVVAAGTSTATSGGLLMPVHAAELFIVQSVRHFTNDGCDFQAAQLFQVILLLHHDDLEVLQVQQLLVFLRNALHISHEEWSHFFAAHDLPKPIDDISEDRKDPSEHPWHG